MSEEEIKRIALSVQPEETTWASGCRAALEQMRFSLKENSPMFVAGVRGAIYHVLKKTPATKVVAAVTKPKKDVRRALERTFFKVLASNLRLEHGIKAMDAARGDSIAKLDRLLRERVTVDTCLEDWDIERTIAPHVLLTDPDLVLNRLAMAVIAAENPSAKPVPARKLAPPAASQGIE